MGTGQRKGTSASRHTQAAPTSLDVARHAGVSQSAVSLVFGGKASGRVSPQTQEAILRAAAELGYRPNQVARTLRSGRSHLIVLAVPDVSNPYFASVLQGAERMARQHHYSVMLASIRDDDDWQQVILDALQTRAIDGCLLCDILHTPHQDYTQLQGKAVLVNDASDELPSLQLDLTTGVHDALTHLLRLRHRRIAHLGAAVDLATFALRHRVYQDELTAAGLPVRADYYEQTPFQLDETTAAAHRLLTRPDPPTAIFCDSDALAIGVYKAAKALQIRIPQDLSVVSIDNSSIARTLEPELTTVAIPTTTIGEQAFLLLLAQLEGQQTPSHITLPLELIIRASTAAIP